MTGKTSFALSQMRFCLEEYCNETVIYKAIEDVYWQYHEAPHRIAGMDTKKALALLSGAIRDYAWLEDEKMYTGFVFDKPEGYTSYVEYGCE